MKKTIIVMLFMTVFFFGAMIGSYCQESIIRLGFPVKNIGYFQMVHPTNDWTFANIYYFSTAKDAEDYFLAKFTEDYNDKTTKIYSSVYTTDKILTLFWTNATVKTFGFGNTSPFMVVIFSYNGSFYIIRTDISDKNNPTGNFYSTTHKGE